jgi:hypothetical protein
MEPGGTATVVVISASSPEGSSRPPSRARKKQARSGRVDSSAPAAPAHEGFWMVKSSRGHRAPPRAGPVGGCSRARPGRGSRERCPGAGCRAGRAARGWSGSAPGPESGGWPPPRPGRAGRRRCWSRTRPCPPGSPAGGRRPWRPAPGASRHAGGLPGGVQRLLEGGRAMGHAAGVVEQLAETDPVTIGQGPGQPALQGVGQRQPALRDQPKDDGGDQRLGHAAGPEAQLRPHRPAGPPVGHAAGGRQASALVPDPAGGPAATSRSSSRWSSLTRPLAPPPLRGAGARAAA